MKLPPSLNRKAIRKSFPRVREATWDCLFDYEKHNGLYKLRVQGPDKFPYYDTEALMQWLVQRGLYRRIDFYGYGEVLFEPGMATVRTHVLAG